MCCLRRVHQPADEPFPKQGVAVGWASRQADLAELRDLPFGKTRWAWGVLPPARGYTGQREVAGVGLYD